MAGGPRRAAAVPVTWGRRRNPGALSGLGRPRTAFGDELRWPQILSRPSRGEAPAGTRVPFPLWWAWGGCGRVWPPSRATRLSPLVPWQGPGHGWGWGGRTLPGVGARGLLAPVSPAARAACGAGSSLAEVAAGSGRSRRIWGLGGLLPKSPRARVPRRCPTAEPAVPAPGGPGCGTAWGCGAGPRLAGQGGGFLGGILACAGKPLGGRWRDRGHAARRVRGGAGGNRPDRFDAGTPSAGGLGQPHRRHVARLKVTVPTASRPLG